MIDPSPAPARRRRQNRRRQSLRRGLLGPALALLVVAAPGSTPADASPPGATSVSPELAEDIEAVRRVIDALEAWDLPTVRSTIGELRGPARELASGALAIYEARYADAESTLAGVVASLATDDPLRDRAEHYLELARGASLALGDAVTLRSADGRFEAAFADSQDAILAPYLFAAMAAAYDEFGTIIGVRPDEPIRFEFYDEPGKLALVTPLTLENIYTTGTVGICKYRRIMMVTPRVMLYGYGWLDTAVHEYVHYVLTLRTGNAAPVWLQEGMAKLLETRWRESSQQPLSPGVAKLLHDALARDELVTLEQMHPSIAMLPSQELAALAYAEAETMLGLLEEMRGPAAMTRLMDEVAAGVDAKLAFSRAWGDDFEAFFATWKATMSRRTAGAGAAAASVSRLAFRDGDEAASDELRDDPSLRGDVFSHLAGGQARQFARLGVLLTLRGHLEAAVIEYEKARRSDRRVARDPKLARRLGELYLELGRADEALELLILAGKDEPENANIAAAEARARRLTGDAAGARVALDRALRQNPFIPGIHCDLAELAEDEDTRARERGLCRE